MMQNRALDNYLNARLKKKPGGSSSYFDFVEMKTKEEFVVADSTATEWAESGKDAFEVQVMDEKTARELKLKYFEQDS